MRDLSFIEGAVQHGLPRQIAEVLASFDVSIAHGELETLTYAVEQLTRTKPQSVRELIAKNREAFLAPAKSPPTHV